MPNTTYKVASGDSASVIAQKNNTTVAELQKLNPQYAQFVKNPNYIQAGWTLNLPGAAPALTPAPTSQPIPAPVPAPTPAPAPASAGGSYIVPSGSNLTLAARAMGISLQQLLDANPEYKSNPNMVRAGAVLKHPGTSPAPAPSPTPTPGTGGPSPTPTPTVLGAPVVYPRKEEADMNVSVIVAMYAELERIKSELGKNVDVSKSQELIDRLITSLDSGKDAPKPISLTDQFIAKKKELGVDVLETELSQKDTELKKFDADYLSTLSEQEQELQSMREINRNKSETQLVYERKRREMAVERDSVANQLNMKYNTVKTLMDYTGMDYDNAQQDYQNKFNQTISLINLTQGVEDRAKTAAERVQDNARANAQIAVNAITASGATYDQLTPTQQTDLTKMGLQSGLGSDFFANVLKNSSGKDILTTIVSADDTKATIIFKDGTSKTISTGLPKKATAATTASKSEIKADQMEADRQTIQSDVGSITGEDRKVDPTKMAALRQDIALNSPELLTWFDNAYEPKNMLNAEYYPRAVRENQWIAK